MDCNVVECEMAERDGGECLKCGCQGGSLDVLKMVQRAYEDRLEMINRSGGANKLEKQVQLFQNWVSDLVGQNALLVRTVEQLEEDITSRLLLERRRHAERNKSEKTCDRVNELKILNESLQKEIETKDREIRRLIQNTEQNEQTVVSLRKEMSLSRYHTPDVSKVDVGVTADICCPGLQVSDVEPVKDYTSVLRTETARYHERLEQIEEKVKSSSDRVRALREANVALANETHTLRQVCVALSEQARLADMRSQFADHLVREMRRQIKQAKEKIKFYEGNSLKVTKNMASNYEGSRTTCNSSMSAGEPCVRQQPRRSLRRRSHLDTAQWDSRGPVGTDDEVSSKHD